jgi:predicted nucleic acid-binding protein
LDRHRRVGLDSNVLIYLLEDAGSLGTKAGDLLDAIAQGRPEGVLATIGVAEVCAGPASAGDAALVERYADELGSLDNIRLIALSTDVAAAAAALRGAGAMSLADAIHLASARSAGATAFVTNDRRIKSVPQLEVIYLDELK